ncbi:ABC transporter ATP-binding protein [Brevundimonas terrae]|uniref:ABC transporter ATP-binding protein n=1 Tax=Brevundimonas terrae TaxID=363631 RepID=A0ABN0YDA4_9CAUL|nr:ATP-binding cassette domain-containing protein [Brevundimonas terrae]NIJ26492.1 phospholipid/cholesterol/gamma-HCH transport system ATP-binding protein [Brevundimonas terrae]
MSASKAPASSSAWQEPVIEVRGMLSQFGERVIHQNLDLTVNRGEIVGVVGGSGTGKTVLLNSIIGLKEPEDGSVKLFGQDRSTMTKAEAVAVEQRTGILFQRGALFSSLNVMENVSAPLLEHTRLSRNVIRELTEMKVAMVGLKPEALYLKPSELSGGMIKRVGLARALALDPELLFLDEPTAGLDPIGAAAFDQLILELSRDLGLTVFMITHDLDSLYTICDQVAVLADKHVIAKAPVAELEKSDHPWIKEYFLGPRGRAAKQSAN